MAALASLYPRIKPFVRNCPEPVMLFWLREAAREFCAETKFARETLLFDSVADQNVYVLTSEDADQEIIGIKAAMYKGFPIAPASFEEVEQLSGETLYFMFTPPSNFWPSPTPTSSISDAFAVSVWTQPTEVATTYPDAVARQFESAIADGAMASLLGMAKAAWGDLPESARRSANFNAEKARARYHADRAFRTRNFRTIPVKW